MNSESRISMIVFLSAAVLASVYFAFIGIVDTYIFSLIFLAAVILVLGIGQLFERFKG